MPHRPDSAQLIRQEVCHGITGTVTQLSPPCTAVTRRRNTLGRFSEPRVLHEGIDHLTCQVVTLDKHVCHNNSMASPATAQAKRQLSPSAAETRSDSHKITQAIFEPGCFLASFTTALSQPHIGVSSEEEELLAELSAQLTRQHFGHFLHVTLSLLVGKTWAVNTCFLPDHFQPQRVRQSWCCITPGLSLWTFADMVSRTNMLLSSSPAAVGDSGAVWAEDSDTAT